MCHLFLKSASIMLMLLEKMFNFNETEHILPHLFFQDISIAYLTNMTIMYHLYLQCTHNTLTNKLWNSTILFQHVHFVHVWCILLGCILQNASVVFSSPEHKVLKVSFCDGPLSVVHRPCVRASTISLNNISSETT